jgi:phosphopantetheinyl transferase
VSILPNPLASPQDLSPAEGQWSQRLGLPFPVALSVVTSPLALVDEPSFLDGEELEVWRALQSRASRKRQHEWLMGRLAVKRAARAWAQAAAQDDLPLWAWAVRTTPAGRPVLRSSAIAGGEVPSVSITHLPEVAVGLAGPPSQSLGVDIERYGRIRLDREAFAPVAFTEAETRLLGADWQRDALTLWVAKEAASKAVGTGFEGRPRRFHVLPSTGAASWMVHCGGIHAYVRNAWFGDYVMAVAWIP